MSDKDTNNAEQLSRSNSVSSVKSSAEDGEITAKTSVDFSTEDTDESSQVKRPDKRSAESPKNAAEPDSTKHKKNKTSGNGGLPVKGGRPTRNSRSTYDSS